MSRIGKKPIEVPGGVNVNLDGGHVKVKGPKGELDFMVSDELDVQFADNVITLEMKEETKSARQKWGMSRTMVSNLVEGVTNGFTKELEIQGVGYRAAMQGKNLQLQLGFSHDVLYVVPAGIEVKTPKPTEIVITGADKQMVGQVAAEIRKYRPPEPFKGKGVRYKDEYIFRKEGKKK